MLSEFTILISGIFKWEIIREEYLLIKMYKDEKEYLFYPVTNFSYGIMCDCNNIFCK